MRITTAKQHKYRFIEFFGSPGVGKSFVLTSQAQSYKESGAFVISSRFQGKGAFALLRLLFTLIGLLRFGLPVCGLFDFRLTKTSLLLMRNWYFSLGVFWYSQKFKSCVLDQGFAQLFWSLVYRDDNEAVLNSQLQFLEKIFIRYQAKLNIIHVIAPKETILVRLHQRTDGKSPLESAAAGKVEQSLIITEKVLNQLSGCDFVNIKSYINK